MQRTAASVHTGLHHRAGYCLQTRAPTQRLRHNAAAARTSLALASATGGDGRVNNNTTSPRSVRAALAGLACQAPALYAHGGAIEVSSAQLSSCSFVSVLCALAAFVLVQRHGDPVLSSVQHSVQLVAHVKSLKRLLLTFGNDIV